MSEKEKPVCAKCGQPHWKFTACENREQADAREAELAIQREKLKVVPESKPPPGYVRVGVNKFARIDAQRPGVGGSSSYVMVAPGKYERRK